MSPKLPTSQLTSPFAVTRTPLAGTPSSTGGLVNCASQPTSSVLSWQRVLPDFVSMNTYPFSGGSTCAPGAAMVVLGGADVTVVGGAAVGRVGLLVGKLGSVGSVGLMTGVPV